MIKVAIVEDEMNYVQIQREFLSRYEKENGVSFSVHVFRNGLDFLDRVREGFDIVFMDIEMPHLDGLTTARKMRETDETVALVFVTNMAQYAINGYEVNAFDYIVKPIDYMSFRMKLARVIRYLDIHIDRGVMLSTTQLGKVRVNYSDIYYFEGDKHYVNVYTKQGKLQIRSAMKELEKQFEAQSFARCSTSFLVNLRYVYRTDAANVYLSGDTALPLSRTKKEEFLSKLSNYYSGGRGK